MTKEDTFIKIAESLELPTGVLNDIFDQFEAYDRFNTYSRSSKIRYEWIKGSTILELAMRYHTNENVIKHAIMQSGEPISGTIRAVSPQTWALYRQAFDEWKAVS